MIWTKRDTIVCITTACIAGFLFIPFLGSVHLFDGDEIKNAEIAREMMITGDYFRTHFAFQPSWEKPPFFFWLQALSMKVFGVNEFAARFPNALLVMLVLPLLYALGKNVTGRGNVGILWVICYSGSVFPALSHKFGFPDPWYHTFVLLSVYAISGYYAPPNGKLHSMRRIALAGMGIGLALITNGALALLLVLLQWFLFWFLRRRTEHFPLTEFAVYCAVALAVSLFWYGAELWRSGLWFFRDFAQFHLHHLMVDNADKGQTFISQLLFEYQPLLLVIGCFPASALIIPTAKTVERVRHTLKERDALATFTLWMMLLLLTTVIVCVIAYAASPYLRIAQTSIAQCASLIYFPLTFLAARALDALMRERFSLSRIAVVSILFFGIIWLSMLVLIPLFGMNPHWLLERTTNSFLRRNLQAGVRWNGWELVIAGGFACILLASAYFLKKQRYFEMAFTLLPATLLAMLCSVVIISPKIEGYTQSAAIEFYQSLQGQSCYIQPLGFSTSADMFYAQKLPFQTASALNIPPEEFELWLLEDTIDHTAYFICTTSNAAIWRKHPNLTELYEKNGFVFLQREVKKKLNLAKKLY